MLLLPIIYELLPEIIFCALLAFGAPLTLVIKHHYRTAAVLHFAIALILVVVAYVGFDLSLRSGPNRDMPLSMSFVAVFAGIGALTSIFFGISLYIIGSRNAANSAVKGSK